MADPVPQILLLAGRLGVADDGGSIRGFLERLGRSGISAQVLCVSGEEGIAPDDRVIECPGLGSRWRRGLAVRRLRPGRAIRRPDLIHVLHSAMAPVGLALAEHWGIPYVQTVDEFLAPRGRLRLSRRWCRKLVAASRDLADDLEANYAVPSHLLAVVCPGTAIAPASPRPVDPAPRVPVIGTAGPLVPASGFATFLGAARRVLDAGVDAEFVIAGQGDDEVDLRRRADRLRIVDRVTFTGPPVVGLRFWNVLDVYCQTSLAPTVGRTLALALASGVPSIVSDIEGLRALVQHGVTGLRVRPDDSAALARAILNLLEDPSLARALGERGRELIRRDFHPDDEARELAEVYRSALQVRTIRLPHALLIG